MKLLLTLLLIFQNVSAGFSLKDDGKFLTIDCESTPEVVVQINKSNGNLQSILVNGTQLQTNPNGSHLNSGFGKSAFKSGTNTLLINNRSVSGASKFFINAFVFDYIGLRD